AVSAGRLRRAREAGRAGTLFGGAGRKRPCPRPVRDQPAPAASSSLMVFLPDHPGPPATAFSPPAVSSCTKGNADAHWIHGKSGCSLSEADLVPGQGRMVARWQIAVILASIVVVIAASLISGESPILSGRMPDSDDYMRLVQVFHWLDTGDWW